MSVIEILRTSSRKVLSVTIADGATDSDPIELEQYRLGGVITGADFDGATLGFAASGNKAGPYQPVTKGGAATAIAVGVNQAVPFDDEAGSFAMWSWIKLVAGTAQTGETTLTLSMKR